MKNKAEIKAEIKNCDSGEWLTLSYTFAHHFPFHFSFYRPCEMGNGIGWLIFEVSENFIYYLLFIIFLFFYLQYYAF